MADDARRALGGDLAPAADSVPAERKPPPLRPDAPDLALACAVLGVFTALGLAIGRAQALVPGAVAGFFLLTVALAAAERRAALRARLERGLVPVARVLLSHMGLLFVPAGVAGVHGLFALPGRAALAVSVALLASTGAALLGTALAMRRFE